MRFTVGGKLVCSYKCILGWPKELDYTEAGDVAKYQKKMLREVNLGFKMATSQLTDTARNCIKQNN